MRVPNIERNMRMYIGRARGVPLKDIAALESINSSRVYQIVTATEYQLNKGNPDYWAEYKRQNGSYARV